MPTNQFDATLAQWTTRKSRELAQEMPMGSPRETDLIAHWRIHRPLMVARLERLQILPQMAHVLDRLRYETQKANLAAGMPPTDAQEQAMKDWLLMEPEESDPSEADPLDRITTSQTPKA